MAVMSMVFLVLAFDGPDRVLQITGALLVATTLLSTAASFVATAVGLFLRYVPARSAISVEEGRVRVGTARGPRVIGHLADARLVRGGLELVLSSEDRISVRLDPARAKEALRPLSDQAETKAFSVETESSRAIWWRLARFAALSSLLLLVVFASRMKELNSLFALLWIPGMAVIAPWLAVRGRSLPLVVGLDGLGLRGAFVAYTTITSVRAEGSTLVIRFVDGREDRLDLRHLSREDLVALVARIERARARRSDETSPPDALIDALTSKAPDADAYRKLRVDVPSALSISHNAAAPRAARLAAARAALDHATDERAHEDLLALTEATADEELRLSLLALDRPARRPRD